MKHHFGHHKLGMKSAHRQAVLAQLVSSLVLHDRIETTLPRAKAIKPIADRIVTLSKKGTLHARRHAITVMHNKEAVDRAFTSFAERFRNRSGGYTRIYRLGFRRGDASPMAMIEYLRETAPQDVIEKSAKKGKKAAEKAEKNAQKNKEEIRSSKKAAKAKKTKGR